MKKIGFILTLENGVAGLTLEGKEVNKKFLQDIALILWLVVLMENSYTSVCTH